MARKRQRAVARCVEERPDSAGVSVWQIAAEIARLRGRIDDLLADVDAGTRHVQ